MGKDGTGPCSFEVVRVFVREKGGGRVSVEGTFFSQVLLGQIEKMIAEKEKEYQVLVLPFTPGIDGNCSRDTRMGRDIIIKEVS